ncbi:MAG: glycosyltransferase family 61 protein [Commensalibacter sp.]|nr:glycosyltransferase family 61 protein [Commensalibacter sp.]
MFRLSVSTREKIKDLVFHQQNRINHHSIETVKIEKTIGCYGSPRWKNIQEFANNQSYPFLHWKHPAETIYRYHLKDITLDVYHMVYFKQNRVITNSNYYLSENLLNSIHIQSDKLIDARDQGAVFCCSDHWENNYFHWMMHAIPAYYAAMQSGIKAKFLLPYPLMLWRKRSLELLGLDLSMCYPIEKEKQYRFSEFYYFDYLSQKFGYSCSKLSEQAYVKMKQNAVVSIQSIAKYDKIYISRVNKNNRHLPNEEKLVEALEKRGYFILNPELYSLDEQIMLFHYAKIVVGLLGAGLSNIVFCQKDTLIYELIPSHHINPCFLVLSLQSGLRYWADKFDSGVDHGAPDHLSAWEKPIDVAFVMKRLDELEFYMRSVDNAVVK